MTEQEYLGVLSEIERLCKIARAHREAKNGKVRTNPLPPMQGSPERLLQLASELEQHGHEEDDEIAAYLRWQAGDV